MANQSRHEKAGTRSRIRASILFGLVLGVFHVFVASIYIEHPPLYDEMYHMLAAESWRAGGELRILDGEYTRTSVFTKVVGLGGYVCGPSIECARGASLATSALLVFSVVVFAGVFTSPAVGFVAGLLLAMNPAAVEVAHLVRFYSLHALAFAIFAFLAFVIATQWSRIGWGALSVLLALALTMGVFSNHLQPTTQIGLLGMVLGLGMILIPNLFGWLRSQKIWVLVIAFLMVFLAAVAGVGWVDIVGIWEALRSGPGWADGQADKVLFYHGRLKAWYPALWPVMAILGLLSIVRWPRISLYCLAIFAVSLLFLSLAGQKANRYLVFALPFLFIPMAGGAVTGLQLVIGFVRDGLKKILPAGVIGRVLVAVAPVAAVLTALVPYMGTQPVVLGVARMATGPDYVAMFGNYDVFADWPGAAGKLRAMSQEYPIVIASGGVKAAYHLGDYSFELNRSTMRETRTGEEFGLDRRTGRQALSTVDSLERILRECGPAMVIIENRRLINPNVIRAEIPAALDEWGTRSLVAKGLWVWTVRLEGPVTDDDVAQSRGSPLECRPVSGLGER